MSKNKESNIIHIDFQARQSETNSTKSFSQLVGYVIPSADQQDRQEQQSEWHDKWEEQLTPSERREQLQKDLEFIRNLEDSSPGNK